MGCEPFTGNCALDADKQMQQMEGSGAVVLFHRGGGAAVEMAASAGHRWRESAPHMKKAERMIFRPLLSRVLRPGT
ncbi:hypothetical protein CBR69_03305 [Bordetella hinzii]|nr:hypothetical protein CBR69_03305 [Bordetella hinzii]